MNQDELSKQLNNLSDLAQGLSSQLSELSQQALTVGGESGAAGGHLPFVALFTVFVLACFVGYHVVWRVTPALHSPLMAVTNAISSVIIVGALIAFGAVQIVPGIQPYVLAMSAASLLYIAMSDLIPDLHRGAIDANAARQVVLIAAGIGTIVLFERMIG